MKQLPDKKGNPDHQGLIDAIANDNVSYLTKFPGIGKKTAGQIVLDLHDKIDHAAALTAAETMVNLLVRRDWKRRRLFIVKRA